MKIQLNFFNVLKTDIYDILNYFEYDVQIFMSLTLCMKYTEIPKMQICKKLKKAYATSIDTTATTNVTTSDTLKNKSH